MIFDTSDTFQREQFKVKAELLAKKGVVVELKERKPQRTQSQNKYLHVALGFFACEVGETLEYVKDKYYKILCNKDIFVREVEDRYLGKIKILRSTSDLDTEEMTRSIERWRNWAAAEGIYIPSPDEHKAVLQMEIELSRNKNYL